MINAAIIGLGRWGGTLLRSVQGKSDKIRFTVGIVRSPDAYADLASEAGLTLADDLDAVLGDPAIDAVVVASPPDLHRDHVCRVAAAGKPVYVDKPFTMTTADAEVAAAACRDAGVPLAVGFNRRFLPALHQMDAWIAEGRIGQILHIEGNHSGPTALRMPGGDWKISREANPAGGLGPRGIHTLDIMIHLCGPVASAYDLSARRVTTLGMDDQTSMLLQFKGGATASLATLMATTNIWRVHVFGSAGSIEMRGENTAILSDLDGKVMATEDFAPVDKERAELEAFADLITDGTPFPVTVAEAIDGVAAFEVIVRSIETGAVVAID